MKKEYNFRLLLSRTLLFLVCLVLSLLLWLASTWLASPEQNPLENPSVAFASSDLVTDTVL